MFRATEASSEGSAQATTATQRRKKGQRPLSEIQLLSPLIPPSPSGTFYLFQDVVRIPDCCSFAPFSWDLGTQCGLFCNFGLPNSKQDGVFLWFYLLIAPQPEDGKCCAWGAGKDSSLENILWNEETSSVTQEWLPWSQQEESTTVLGFPKKLLLPQQLGLLEKEGVSMSQEERVLKFVIKVRIIIQARSS